MLPSSAHEYTASSVGSSCTFQYSRKYVANPSSTLMMSGFPAGPCCPLREKDEYTLARPDLKSATVLYTVAELSEFGPNDFGSRSLKQDVTENRISRPGTRCLYVDF